LVWCTGINRFISKFILIVTIRLLNKIMNDSELIDEIMISLRRVIRAIDQHSRTLIQTHGLTGPQALMLTEIARSDGITGSELAKRASLSQATVTDVVKRLEAKGLIARGRDEKDKRKFVLVATEKGKDLIKDSVPLLQERFAKRLLELKDWERTQLLASLQHIAEMMNAEDMDASPVLASGALTATAQAVEEAVSPPE
jgi:DNA-binding MarR family transcriptional regulator